MIIVDKEILWLVTVFLFVFTVNGIFKMGKAFHDMRRAKKKYEKFIREMEREEDDLQS